MAFSVFCKNHAHLDFIDPHSSHVMARHNLWYATFANDFYIMPIVIFVGAMATRNPCYATSAKVSDLPPRFVFAVFCRCWIYLTCRESRLSGAVTLKTLIYVSSRDPLSCGVMTRSNLCYAMFAQDLAIHRISVLAVCCRCWIYIPWRESHLSCAVTPKTLIYIRRRDPHSSDVMTRSKLCCAAFASDSDIHRKLCQIQKERDEQARCEFTGVAQ